MGESEQRWCCLSYPTKIGVTPGEAKDGSRPLVMHAPMSKGFHIQLILVTSINTISENLSLLGYKSKIYFWYSYTNKNIYFLFLNTLSLIIFLFEIFLVGIFSIILWLTLQKFEKKNKKERKWKGKKK